MHGNEIGPLDKDDAILFGLISRIVGILHKRKIVTNRCFGWFKVNKQPQLLRVALGVTFSQTKTRAGAVHTETVLTSVFLRSLKKNTSVFSRSESHEITKTTFSFDTDPCLICQEGRNERSLRGSV